MTATWPTRGQQAPNFWDTQLKAYIDEAVTSARVADALAQEPAKAADLAQAALAANPLLAKRRANSVVIAGDSFVQLNGGIGTQSAPGVISAGQSRTYRPGGFFNWAQIALGHRLQLLKNAGIGGETSTQLLARYATDVLAYHPALTIIQIGTNDAGINSVSSAVPIAETKANILAMVDASQAQGSLVVIGTIAPRGFGGQGVRGAAAKTHALTLNAWLRRLPYLRPGVVLVDYYAVLANPASEDQWLSGYANSEGNIYTHPSALGAYTMGQALAAALSPIVPNVMQVTRVTNDPTNLITTDRVLFPGAAAGVAPSGWTTAQAAMVTGLFARTDGIPGNWLEIVVPNGGVFSMSRDLTSLIATGDAVLASVEFSCSGLDTTIAVPTAANQALSWGFITTPTLSTFDLSNDTTSDQPHGSMSRSGVLQPPAYTRQGTDTNIQVGMIIRGGGTYRFACPTVVKV